MCISSHFFWFKFCSVIFLLLADCILQSCLLDYLTVCVVFQQRPEVFELCFDRMMKYPQRIIRSTRKTKTSLLEFSLNFTMSVSTLINLNFNLVMFSRPLGYLGNKVQYLGGSTCVFKYNLYCKLLRVFPCLLRMGAGQPFSRQSLTSECSQHCTTMVFLYDHTVLIGWRICQDS